MSLRIRLLTLLGLAAIAVAQTADGSGTATANLNKRIFVTATNEIVALSDAIAITYRLDPAQPNARITVNATYAGRGEGQLTSRSYSLTGVDEQIAEFVSETPGRTEIVSNAVLKAAYSTEAIPVRVKLQISLEEDMSVVVFVTGVEVAQ